MVTEGKNKAITIIIIILMNELHWQSHINTSIQYSMLRLKNEDLQYYTQFSQLEHKFIYVTVKLFADVLKVYLKVDNVDDVKSLT